jgi:hypothetical protein
MALDDVERKSRDLLTTRADLGEAPAPIERATNHVVPRDQDVITAGVS